MLAFRLGMQRAWKFVGPALLAAAAPVAPASAPSSPVDQPPALVSPAPGRSPQNASYVLDARLDPASRTITGTGRLAWRNMTSRPATELRFHLYWNAWRDTRSSWMREQVFGRNARLLARPPADFATLDLTTLDAGSGPVLGRAAFIAPDDGNADDRTVLSVPLDRPVSPGETREVSFAWTARVPRTFARTGVLGDYYFIAHWFPKIAVLEERGWTSHQFHAATEFFADFGRYDVTLTVPAGWIVGATGQAVAPASTTPLGPWIAHRFVATDVHDFAWTTSPDFVERRERFDAPGLPPVDVRLLLQPEHVPQAARHFDAARAALDLYGRWFGPYPYGHLTIVDPVTPVNAAVQGESTGGMEYPMLITAGTRWLAPWRGAQPESVTVHEAGHQYWYGIVATNEVEHAWMDEGLNTYATARVLAERWPGRFVATERYFGGLVGWPFRDAAWSRDVDGNRMTSFRPFASYDEQATPTWQYWPGSASAQSYNKTALWLTMLERRLGWPVLQRALATYFTRGAFRHPTPGEFMATVSEVAGEDLTWFFDAVHRSSASFDYGVAQVTHDAASATVVVRRHGDGVYPIAIRVTSTDGTVRTESWDGRARWRAFTYPGRLARVEIDPDAALALDLNRTNNSWSAQPRGAAAASKWAWRWLAWFQEVLLTYAFVA
jgi:hypothetical protein